MKSTLGWIALGILLTPIRLAAGPGERVAEWPAPGRTCTGLAFDGKLLWVADHGLDQLIAVDPNSGAVVRRLKSPGYRPAGLAFDGQELWNADTRAAMLYRVRPADGLVTRAVPAPVAEPRALAFDGRALWVSDEATRSIHRVDPADGTTISELPFPGPSVDGLAHDGRYLWVADRLADRLLAVQPDTGDVVVNLPAPGPHVTGLAFQADRLLALDYQSDRIYALEIDGENWKIRTDPREAWVVFTEQMRNFGPDPMPSLDVFMAVPGPRDSQELLSGPRFEPTPTETRPDRWDQPVARFAFADLPAGGVATVRLIARVRAWTVRYVIWPHKVTGLWKIPAEVRRRYLDDAPKYDLHNPIIQKAVAEAVGSQKNPYWIARKIYRYVHQKLRYERVGGWDVAPKVLARGSGSCSEYSFVFIAMCRAAGLPARFVGALVVRRDEASFDDVFHRWVEVYLPPYGWVPVDPSRGDKPTELERGDSFGLVTHDFLITTQGGGGSELLDWNYNANQRSTCLGRCKVEEESIAEWSPEDPFAPLTPAVKASGASADPEPAGPAGAKP